MGIMNISLKKSKDDHHDDGDDDNGGGGDNDGGGDDEDDDRESDADLSVYYREADRVSRDEAARL